MVSDSTRLLSGAVIRAAESLLTNELTEKLGYAFALWLAKRLGTTPDRLSVSVGHDSRPSGPRLQHALIDGLTAADADVYDCGLATTPAMQMSIMLKQIRASGAVMVTASARESGMNGFKFFTPDGPVSAEDSRGDSGGRAEYHRAAPSGEKARSDERLPRAAEGQHS